MFTKIIDFTGFYLKTLDVIIIVWGRWFNASKSQDIQHARFHNLDSLSREGEMLGRCLCLSLRSAGE